MLLEVAWEALEHAGIAADRLVGSAAGVFIGISSNDYNEEASIKDDDEVVGPYLGTGMAHSASVGRISYVLGLEGPNFAVDTACSSSLVAVHQACQSLRAGDCDLALTGGVNVMLAPKISIAMCKARMLAADGRCKTFDAAADGYVRGEGCGVVVLKRLADAELAMATASWQQSAVPQSTRMAAAADWRSPAVRPDRNERTAKVSVHVAAESACPAVRPSSG